MQQHLQFSQRLLHHRQPHLSHNRNIYRFGRSTQPAAAAAAYVPATTSALSADPAPRRARQLLVELLRDVIPAEQITIEQARSIAHGLALQQDAPSSSALHANMHLLLALLRPSEALEVVCRQPRLLLSPLDAWFAFLTAYGIPEEQLPRLLVTCPELFAGSIYATGEVILTFKRLGWHDKDILERIVHYYPHLLANTVAADMEPVLEFLAQQGCSQKDIQLLAWEFPRIFSHDYRRHVRKFQRLGVYGLHMPSNKH